MTVNSDLLLSMSYTPPTGGRKSAMANDIRKTQDRPDYTRSQPKEKSHNSFKKHLDKEIEAPHTTKTSAKRDASEAQRPDKVAQNNTQNNTGTDAPDDQTKIPAPSTSDQSPSRPKVTGEENTKETSPAQSHDPDTDTDTGTDTGTVGISDPEITQPEKPSSDFVAGTSTSNKNTLPEDGPITQTEQTSSGRPAITEKENNGSASQIGSQYLSQEEFERAIAFSGKAQASSEGATVASQTPGIANDATAKGAGTTASEVTTAENDLIPEEKAAPTSGTKGTAPQNVDHLNADEVSTSQTPNKGGQGSTESPGESSPAQSPTRNHDLLQNAEKYAASQEAAPVIEDTPGITETPVQPDAPADVSNSQAAASEQNLAAVATAQSSSQPQNEEGKRLKDNDRNSSKSDQIADTAKNKKSAAHNASENAKSGSENSANDQGSAASGRTPSTSPAPTQQTLTPSASPFLSELNHLMTGNDLKPLNTQQPQTGLLALQEVGASHGLMATGHAKGSMPQVTPQMVTHQINIAIAKHANAGQNSFRVSLKPAELGQVDIRMDFHSDGKMSTTVIVDNERTLNLLQRDQGALEKTLQNAGFEMGDNNLNFSLKQQQQEQHQSSHAQKSSHDEENEFQTHVADGIAARQHMKMVYSDNALDINI